MNIRKIALLGTAGLIALGTAQATRWMTAPPPPSQTGDVVAAVRPQPIRKVLVAAADLPAGLLVQADQLRWREWPEDGTDGYMVEGVRTREEFVGAVVRMGLRAGEPIVEGRLVKPGERGFLAAVLEPGMRAVSVPINAITGIAGFIFPGDRVDVILTHALPRPDDVSRKDRRASETVLTNVRVLAVDQKTSDQQVEPQVGQTATLEITPKQAELLPLLVDLGQLSLSLRSLDQTTDATGTLVTLDTPRSPTGIVPVALAKAGTTSATLANAAPAATPRAPARPSYSWDSDASAVIPDPADKEALTAKIRVLRGQDAGEVAFDRSRR